MHHKSGFVNIIGKPNVGKSTLMNALIGQELSIVTPKAQTTRHRIKGILNGDDFQVVFSDTPGIMKPSYKLHERMLGAVDETLSDADIVLYVTELGDRTISDELKEKLAFLSCPLYLVINKIDLGDQQQLEEAMAYWQETVKPSLIIPISALHHFGQDVLLDKILAVLPEGPPYFEKDESLSDRNVRFFVADFIRERNLNLYQKEIPYSVEVNVHEYKEMEKIDHIKVNIFVARESQKAIILGHQGKAIKKLGIESRKKIEEFVGKQVHLELTVKVLDDWRNNERALRGFGYEY